MTEWAPKRFYKDATVAAEDGGYAVRLDGRPIRTPGKRAIIMPSRQMAEAVAGEWQAQDSRIDPATMPWQRSVNSAIDKVAFQRGEVAAHLVGYAGTDLLCYRAEAPEGLIHRQASAWDPFLDWLTQRHSIELKVTSGVMPVDQDADALPRLAGLVAQMSDFQLTGFHDLVGLSGSFVLALATIDGVQPVEDVWEISRIDESWQIEQWGDDEEAAEAAEKKRQAFLHAFRFYSAASSP
ncbi:MAG: ATPase [Boseongicola sp.]|nr:ATPase [Boseongicola sp.]